MGTGKVAKDVREGAGGDEEREDGSGKERTEGVACGRKM